MRSLWRALAGTAIVCGILIFISITIGVLRMAFSSGAGEMGQDHVAVIELEGVILDASDFLREIERVGKNDRAKAVVVRINSPGGVVGPSQEFYQALKRLDGKKPVIVSMGAVAASGGYYAALGGRKIYASPGTLTASIGVIMEFVNTQRLYEWARIERYTLKAGKMKDVGNPARPMTREEREFLNGLLQDIHTQFRAAVKERRKVPEDRFDDVTDGRIMTGRQAFEAQLVDALGGLPEALRDARETAGLAEDSPVSYPKPEKGMIEKYLFGTGAFSDLLERMVSQTAPLPLSTGWHVLLLASLIG